MDPAKLHNSVWLEIIMAPDSDRFEDIPRDADGYLVEPRLINYEHVESTFKQKEKKK